MGGFDLKKKSKNGKIEVKAPTIIVINITSIIN